jgi:hypothetical protein
MKIDVVKQITHAGNITLQLTLLALIIIYVTQYTILIPGKTSTLYKIWIFVRNTSACTLSICVT